MGTGEKRGKWGWDEVGMEWGWVGVVGICGAALASGLVGGGGVGMEG